MPNESAIQNYSLARWENRLTTTIGPRLRLGFRKTSFIFGFKSKKTSSTLYPSKEAFFHLLQEHLGEDGVDAVIDQFQNTITIEHIQKTFSKWSDIEDNTNFVNELTHYLNSMQLFVAKGIVNGEIEHSKFRKKRETIKANTTRYKKEARKWKKKYKKRHKVIAKQSQ
eukprot:856750_1